LHLIRTKYSSELPKVYKELLDNHPGMVGWPVAKAFARSSLPRAQKVEMFSYGARNKSLDHRVDALSELQDLNSSRFVKLLIENLKPLRAKPKESSWGDAGGQFVYLVMCTDDPRAWRALARAAKQSEVGGRLAIMGPMDRPCKDEGIRRRRLDFLAAFLDDAAVRDAQSNPGRYEVSWAGGPYFPRLEVRSFAAMQIASILELPIKPRPSWKPEQWAELRKQARQALERYRKKTKE
jgi:hypothetical protein